MPRVSPPVAPHYASFQSLVSHVRDTELGNVDARDWTEEWGERWVAFVDLIGFASRAMQSESVVLNNILRFDRASQLAASEFPNVRVHRFSDATFAIANTFHEALAFAVAISHSCLAFNVEMMTRSRHAYFIHLIAPRVTLAQGQVLLLPEEPPNEERFAGLDSESVVAGSAIVNAYALERHSAGGLITAGSNGLEELRDLSVRGTRSRVRNGVERWITRLGNPDTLAKGDVLCVRGGLADVPWLLLRPLQNDPGTIWTVDGPEADAAIRAYLEMWQRSVQEFYSPQTVASPLEVTKHYAAATRHGVQSFQMCHGKSAPRFQTISDVAAALPPWPPA